MFLQVLRAIFVLLMAALGWAYIQDDRRFSMDYTWYAVAIPLVLAVVLVCVDILSPRRKLAIFSGTFFGLVVGILIAYGLSFAVHLLFQEWQAGPSDTDTTLEKYVNLAVGMATCYLSISFILQTKDDFRFIVPYVEFAKERRGARPVLLDTSALIDGRINDIAMTGVLDYQLIVPRFVILELQTIADSADNQKRNRGRRGLDALAELQNAKSVDVTLYDASHREAAAETDVDQKLVGLALELGARILTTDFNLNKVAQVRGVDVINLNDLANALKPAVLPGEKMTIRIIKSGDQPGQGVGYLDDGTMVVVEQGRNHLDEEVEFIVNNVRQNSAGKMIFGRLVTDGSAPRKGNRPPIESSARTS